MIKNQWYAILESKEVKKKPVGVTRLNEKLVLWRGADGKLNCIYDLCCHRGASLAIGCIKDNQIECPFHGFLYDGSGQVTLIPANGKADKVPSRYKVHSYIVKEKAGLIWLWYSDSNDGDIPEIPFFEELLEGFIYKTFAEVWPVHYTRAAENQMDVVHLPFVHTSTIGKGNKTIINGPVVKWQDNRMTFYVDNVFDDGQTKALKADQIENYESLFKLDFQMPNTWQNYIDEKVRVFAVFAPIDEENTKIYLRFYQKFLPVPIIGGMITSISNIFNRVILHQDRRVVLTQVPKKTELAMGENLIPGDLPIIEFRKRRKLLKETAN
ncbi:MAG: aromatic ring-hydroxylating dioxygenase subunit alpha [Vallitaleaceae bacterium]|jgi:phenylpropionate dioxygenase-like ring-hydroxylating dioxygenase large terminal subunit|nr:aromatic ring-hydroxylating dioxygenase subunit alpha [Vallitaleaceae bacterium]